MPRFEGKTVLISGGARGQGAVEARMIVAEGGKVVITDVLVAEGQALAAELGEAARFLRQDVTDEAGWEERSRPPKRMGGLHGLVNNAGIYIPTTLMETDAALFERHMRINQLGCFLGMKAVVPAMERSGGGSIVNISSDRRAARLAGRPCLQRDEMGAARHDQGGRDRPRAAGYPGEFGPSRADRHRDAEGPHRGAEPRAAARCRCDARAPPPRWRSWCCSCCPTTAAT